MAIDNQTDPDGPFVQITEPSTDDGAAELTVSVDDEDHLFEVWVDGDEINVAYQETATWRGQIEVSEPRDEVWQALITSTPFQQFTEEATHVRRVS